MIDPEVEAQIEAGLRAGRLSQRALAREVHVSRGSVGAIAAGKRPGDLSRQRTARGSESQPPVEIGRCPHCGCLVELPCRALLAELALEERGTRGEGRGARGQGSGSNGEALTIGLRDEDAERYLALRHEKEAEFFRGMVIDTAEARAAEEENEDLPTMGELAEIEWEIP